MTEALVAGAGIIGQVAALGLAGQGRKVRLIERLAAEPSGSGRLFTLNWPARRMLARILPALPPTQPIRQMRIFAPDGQMLKFDADAAGIACLAATVLEDDLIASLAAARSATGLNTELDIQPTAATLLAEGWQVTCAGESIAARLLVAADGASSPTAKAAGLLRRTAGATQQIETGWLATGGTSDAIAWQWFTPRATLALLPAADGRINFILSRPINSGKEEQEPVAAEKIIAEVCQSEIGRCRLVDEPRTFCATPGQICGHRPRLAPVGDCAQSVYPLSGQGLTVGLGDVEELLDCLAGESDPGAGAALKNYRRRRSLRARATIEITKFFANANNASSPAARLLGLAARINKTPAATLFAHLANAR